MMLMPILAVALLAPPQSVVTADSAVPSWSVVAPAGSWSTQNGPGASQDLRWLSLVESTGSASAMLATGTSGTLDLAWNDGTGWGGMVPLASPAGDPTGAAVGAGFESRSGRLLTVYTKPGSALVYTRIYDTEDSPSLSGEDWVDLGLAVEPSSLTLVPKPGSDTILLVGVGGTTVRAAVWDGSEFGAGETLTPGFTGEPEMLAAEWRGPEAFVIWANAGSASMEGAAYDGTEWGVIAGLPIQTEPITRITLSLSNSNSLLMGFSTSREIEAESDGSSSSGPSWGLGPVIYAGGSLSTESGCVINGDVVEGESDSMPSEPSPTGSSLGNLTVDDGQTVSPSPGRYGELHAKNNAVIQLTAGDYFFDTWKHEHDHITIEADTSGGPVRLIIENGDLESKKEFTTTVSAGLAAFEIHLLDGDFEMDKDATLNSSVIVYNGDIEFKKDATVNGFLLASENVSLEKDGTVSAPTFSWPGTTSTPDPDPDPVMVTAHSLWSATYATDAWGGATTLADGLASPAVWDMSWEGSGDAAFAVWQNADETTLQHARLSSGSWSSFGETADLGGPTQRLIVRPTTGATDSAYVLGSVLIEGSTHPLAGYLAYSLDHMHLDGSVVPNGLTGADEGYAMPTPPTLASGSTKIKIEKNETLSLAPGAYGELEMKEDSVLNLVAGDYVFSKVKKGKKDVTINADTTAGPIRIVFDSGNVEFEDRFTLTTIGPGPVGVHVLDGKFKAKKNAAANASFISYVKEVEFGEDSTIVGHLIAKKHIKIDENSTLDPPSWGFPFSDNGSISTNKASLFAFTTGAGAMGSQTLIVEDWAEPHTLPFDLGWARPKGSVRVTSWREVPSSTSP